MYYVIGGKVRENEMPNVLKDDDSLGKWTVFFEEKYKSEIETISSEYPETRSLIIDYWDLDRFDSDLAELLLNQPYKVIFNAEMALKNIDTARGKHQFHLKVTKLPDWNKSIISNLRSHHYGTFISIEGIVKRKTEVCPKLQEAAFICQKCGAVIKVSQDEDILKEPVECYEDQGGCGRTSKFKLSTSLSTFVDAEQITLQERPESLDGSQQPQDITVFAEDDLVGKLHPGDRVIINGILHPMMRRRKTLQLTSFGRGIQANSFEIDETAFESIQISDEEVAKFRQVAKSPNLYEDMINSIVPSIKGLTTEKNSLLFQSFGGNEKHTKDGSRIRGDIHILLIGDPGTGKSQVLNFMKKLIPRSIKTGGRTSSEAGLTATSIREEDGYWSVVGGSMVLADRGLLIIEEFDKMKDTDRQSIHPAMEQQEITVDKAGNNVTFKSRCAVLAAANPKTGRFDSFMPITEQFNLKPALLSRFDVIFAITDNPNIEKDKEIADHILNTHQNPDGKHIEPVYSADFIRKYIAYAKQKVRPKISDKVKKILKEYYVELRSSSKDSIALCPRQLESLVRLSEASAKVRLRKTVTVEDAKRALKIYDQFLRRVGMDRETGQFDMDIILTGMSHSQHQRMKSIHRIIENLSEDSTNKYATRDDIIGKAEDQGIEEKKTEESLDRLKRDGEIYEPEKHKFRLVREF